MSYPRESNAHRLHVYTVDIFLLNGLLKVYARGRPISLFQGRRRYKLQEIKETEIRYLWRADDYQSAHSLQRPCLPDWKLIRIPPDCLWMRMRCFLFRLRYYSNDQWNIRAHVNAAGEICGHDISHIGILSSHNLKSVTDLINRAKQSVNSDFFCLRYSFCVAGMRRNIVHVQWQPPWTCKYGLKRLICASRVCATSLRKDRSFGLNCNSPQMLPAASVPCSVWPDLSV